MHIRKQATEEYGSRGWIVCQDKTERPRRVCYFGTYRDDYSRNQIMIEGLRRSGLEVIECHEQLWQGIEDRVQVASGGWFRLGFALRVVPAYWRLLVRHRLVKYDVMVLGYPGQLDVYLARILTWLRRKPLVLDVFMSLYLVAWERGLADRHPVTAGLVRLVEKAACSLPDLLILDTAEYVAWFEATYGISPGRFRLVPTGADDRLFRPVDTQRAEDGPLVVMYYGTFIPNHGTEYIVEAARILVDDTTVCFELVGEGPECEKAMSLARRYGLTNIRFVDWLGKDELLERVACADICLGAFGTTPQSQMTVQNKIYEGLAMAKPLITGDSPTIRRVMQHGKHVYLCARADPHSLAQAIRSLAGCREMRERLSKCGHRLFVEQFDLEHNGRLLASHLREVSG
jgi:glycosyltransferase involved in cell wall biosynthesis